MVRQNLTAVFNKLRDENDFGAREYRVAEMLAPMVGVIAPATNALFIGQEYVDTALGKKYYAVATDSATPADDWAEIATV